jgi:pimeloyl-ACP methyl ester carboxylesterase
MERLKLEAEVVGPEDGAAVVILHGLLGNSRNWAGIVKVLEERYRVAAVDLRNHGRSPHADSMSYKAMAEDVAGFIEETFGDERPVHLIGHSMGGKTAMAVACRFPSLVRSLIVVDIAPKTYAPRWREEFALMRSLPVASLKSRSEAEKLLEPGIRDWAFRKFLLTNLERLPEGGFRWTINLAVLETALPSLFHHSLEDAEQYAGPTLFLRGERSKYFAEGDEARVRHHFPEAAVETVEGAGHNVHFDQPAAFLEHVRAFFASA